MLITPVPAAAIGLPNFNRSHVEDLIEALIESLDALDSDVDAEPDHDAEDWRDSPSIYTGACSPIARRRA